MFVADDLAAEGPQGGRLAALALAEDDEMRLGGEIHCYRLQFGLTDAHEYLSCAARSR